MNLNLSVSQRLNLTFGLLVFLVIIASGVGIWFASDISQAVEASRASAAQVAQLADLQFVWAEAAAAVDNMLLTRQVSSVEREIEASLTEFDGRLAQVAAEPFGQSEVAINRNQPVVKELVFLGAELDQVVADIIDLAEEQRWAQAGTLRRTEMASFQRRFDDGLLQLSDNTQEEASQLATRLVEAQQAAQTVWIITMIVAVTVGIAASVVTSRSIVQPVQALTAQARRVTQRDFQPITPLVQRDEIGELSRTFALMTDWLRESYQTLEQRVSERTRRLETVATLSEHLNTILNVQEVLQTVVDQVQEKFGYYHAHIYLFDDRQENLVVAAGTGRAAAVMKSEGHSIAGNESSLVARAARLNQVILIEDVSTAKDWLPNPLLPETRSEMAVPIVIEGQVVGVLDVQSDTVAGLDTGDANLIRSLANQVAVAIRNARLFEEVKTALAEANEAQARYTVQTWDRHKIAQVGGHSLYLRADLELSDELRNQIGSETQVQDSSNRQPEKPTADLDDELAAHTVVTPVEIRNQRLGTVQLHAATRDWSEDDLAIIQAVVDQLAQTAENVRLFDETRERASQEFTIRRITERMRAASSVENLIRITIRELGHHLGAGRTVVSLTGENR